MSDNYEEIEGTIGMLEDPLFKLNIPKEITIRKGEAKPEIEYNGIEIEGAPGCVVEYITKRRPEYNTTHVVVNRTNRTISLTDNEDVESLSNWILEKIQIHPDIDAININGAAHVDPNGLAVLLKRYRRHFKNANDGMKLIAGLTRFNAHVQKQIDKINDQGAGKFRNAVDVVTQTSLPTKIDMSMQVLRGVKESKIDFEVELHVAARDSGKIEIALVSYELEEAIVRLTDEIIDQQLAKIDDEYCVFEI